MKRILLTLLMAMTPLIVYAGTYEITTPGNNVGIGSTNPGTALDVQGTVRAIGEIVNGNINIGDVLIGNSSNSPTVVFQGDSLTFGSYGTYPYNHWITLPTYNTQNLTSYNIGIAGETVLQMYQNEGINQNPLFSFNSGLNIIVVWGGTNDLANGNTPQTTYSYLQRYCKHMQQLGWKVIVVSMISRVGQDSNKNTYNSYIRNNWIQFADALADIGLDPNIGIDNSYSNGTYFYTDNVHLIDAGYKIVASYVQTAINNVVNNSFSYFGNNIGIGTTLVNSNLTISGNIPTMNPLPGVGYNPGNIHIYPTTGSEDSLQSLTFGSSWASGGGQTSKAGAGIYVQSGSGYGSRMFLGTTSNFNSGVITKVSIMSNGNTGIGTISPNGLLEVGNQEFDVLSTGNVGIGSVTPGQALDVQGTVRAFKGFANGVNIGTSGTGSTSCLCKTYSGGICTVIGTCT